MPLKNWKKEIFTLPNLLSLFRLALIPVYVSIYLNARNQDDYFLAVAILAVSCLTDLIDGKIARRFNLITTVGKVLDPLADKATQFTLIVCLTVRYRMLLIVVWLFVAKELFQLIAGTIQLKKGKILKGALLSGKICTTILFCSLILLVLLPSPPIKFVRCIIFVDIVCLLTAFADYVYTYFKREAMFQTIDESLS